MKTSAFFAIPAKVLAHLAGGGGDAGIVEDEDFVLGQAVKDGRIPVVQVAGEVLVEDDRIPALPAPTPIGETNPVRQGKLRGYVSAVYVLMVRPSSR